MTGEEVLKNLGITDKGIYDDKDESYTISYPDSDAFGKIYSKLDDSPDLTADDNETLLTDKAVSMRYSYEDDSENTYSISLIGDWQADDYKLVIKQW